MTCFISKEKPCVSNTHASHGRHWSRHSLLFFFFFWLTVYSNSFKKEKTILMRHVQNVVLSFSSQRDLVMPMWHSLHQALQETQFFWFENIMWCNILIRAFYIWPALVSSSKALASSNFNIIAKNLKSTIGIPQWL